MLLALCTSERAKLCTAAVTAAVVSRPPEIPDVDADVDAAL